LEPLIAGGGWSIACAPSARRAAIDFGGHASSNRLAAPSAANGFNTTGAGWGASGAAGMKLTTARPPFLSLQKLRTGAARRGGASGARRPARNSAPGG